MSTRRAFKTGDEFTAPIHGTVVPFRAVSDETIAQDGSRRPFVWATPLRPLNARGLSAEMVVFVDRDAFRIVPPKPYQPKPPAANAKERTET